MTARPGRISLLVPSRGRPVRCRAMWESALDTARYPDLVELVLYLDDDDPQLGDYQRWAVGNRQLGGPVQVIDVVGPRIVLSETWNRLAGRAGGEILWHGNDDVAFRSSEWDEHVRQAFAACPDGLVLVHGRDGIHDAGMATLGFYHRAWVELFGGLVPPYFSSDYNDTWNTEVADQAGRRVFLQHVYTEHLHPAVNGPDGQPKGPLDQTHRERLQRHREDGVDQRYRDLAPERAAWAEKLHAAIQEG